MIANLTLPDGSQLRHKNDRREPLGFTANLKSDDSNQGTQCVHYQRGIAFVFLDLPSNNHARQEPCQT